MPDHTIPGAWAGRLSLPGDWTPYHTVPGQWVGDATATTPSAWPVATVAATAIETSTAYDRASAWPLAAIDATGVAPSTSATTPSAWPSASVEATGNAPTTVVTYASFWPVASTEVTAFAPSTTSSASLVEDWYWHVLSLTHNGNLPEDAGNYVGLASTETTGVTLDSSGDVLANVSTLPNLTNPLNNNFTHTSNASGADVDKVFVDVPNFYGQPTSGTDFDTSVNVLVATWQHFDTEWSTDPEILLMSSIAEPGVGNAFSWTGSAPGTCTRAEFDDWASFNKGTTRRNWFTSTLITEAASDEPSGTFAAIDPMAYIWDAIRGTDLNDFDCADWYSDAAPHGNPDWYAALGMTIWTIMMDREGVSPIAYPSGDVTWPTGVTTAFQNAASAFATRLSNLVDGTAATPNAPQTDEIDIATGSGSSEIDVTVNSVPETLTNIEYSVNGGSSWANLGRTTAGSQTLTMAAGSTSYSFLWRYTNATGTGQVSVSSSGGHWTATSSAGSGVNSAWPVASVEITGLVPTASTTTASAWPVAAAAITGFAPSTGSSVASSWPVAAAEVTGLVPATALTIASSWPAGSAEITGYAPTTVEGGTAPSAVTFDGTNDYLNGFGLSSSATEFTIVLQVNGAYTASTNILNMGEAFTLFFNATDSFAWFIGAVSGVGFGFDSMPNAASNDMTMMVSVSQSGALPGGNTLQIHIDETLMLSSTGAVTTVDMSGLHVFAGEAGGAPYWGTDAYRVWISDSVALDGSTTAIWDAFADSGHSPVALSAPGTVDSNTPDIFIEGDAATWNSSGYMNGSVT